MKNLILSICLGFFLISCGSDDCTSDDFIGSYTGTIVCSDGQTEDVTAAISEGNDNSIVIVIDGESYDVEIDGCDLIIPETSFEFFGIVTTTSGEGELDGSVLSITQKLSAFGISETCDIVMSK